MPSRVSFESFEKLLKSTKNQFSIPIHKIKGFNLETSHFIKKSDKIIHIHFAQ